MSQITVYAIHKPEEEKLETVMEQMHNLGAPTTEVVDCGDHYVALEGSHRLAAAAKLEIQPTFIIHEQDELIEISKFDWYDKANWAETCYAAGEVAGELYSTQARGYWFEK